MKCDECNLLTTAKEQSWKAYQKQKHRSKSEVKSTEEIDHLLEEYKIASARLRYHLAVKQPEEGHRVNPEDIQLLNDEDGPVSC
jgi:ribosomal protein L29